MHPENGHRTKVLLVDDENKILRFLGLKLRLMNYDVTTADNGPRALELIKSSSPPDVIVLDILMPLMDGFEVLKKLRSFSKLPVIVLSAKGDNAERARELGSNDFLAKPFMPEDLAEKIEANLDHGVKPYKTTAQ